MKRLIITAIFCGMLGSVYAQQNQPDTIKMKNDTVIIKHRPKKTNNIHIDSEKHEAKPGFSIGLTVFSDFYLGFATMLDNGSFTLSAKNDFLSYNQAKTSNVGFNFFKFGYRFNDNFKVTLNAGFDWTLIRLHQNIDIVPDVPTLQYVVNNTNHYSKNRFSSNYLLLPLSFDLRTSRPAHGDRFSVIFGPEVGFLIDGMQKQISPERGKTKNFNDFHFTRFEYGGFTRIGYGNLGIYAKYYFNDMFENSPNQAGLKSFSFGITTAF